jgi:hypothetical protein
MLAIRSRPAGRRCTGPRLPRPDLPFVLGEPSQHRTLFVAAVDGVAVCKSEELDRPSTG